MNLETHLSENDEDIKQVILRVGEAAKTISRGFAARRGVSGSSNVYGERQAAMDVWADELLISTLGASGQVRCLASEEQPGVLTFEGSSSDLGVTIDPLDGSSLIDVNLTVGILHRGGVYSYPAYSGGEEGKLRLLFEAAPMGFIVSQAGGAASDGRRDLLSIKPEAVSQRGPVYIGGKREIQWIEDITKTESDNRDHEA